MSQLWVPAYVAIGSNLDGPVSQVQSAIRQLALFSRSRLISQSRLYRSLPLGPQDQPEFVNAAVAMLTQLAPRELLNELKQLELSMGRAATTVRWGPRRIDLDLLLVTGRSQCSLRASARRASFRLHKKRRSVVACPRSPHPSRRCALLLSKVRSG